MLSTNIPNQEFLENLIALLGICHHPALRCELYYALNTNYPGTRAAIPAPNDAMRELEPSRGYVWVMAINLVLL